ncbi:MAG TPA: hypothetical protein VFK51_06045 [Burkholderiales bacterium]|jgi:hypothetical protein|nr:hypothetical protein [Burkholderiales bacterium]
MARGRINHRLRSQIAQIAARLMAEDGIEDYGFAKRKAARQVGAVAANWPDNREIEAALRAYRALYQADEHRETLRRLRELAVSVMRELEHFRPHLTGSVLNGNAGTHARLALQLFADDIKALEFYMIDRGVPYRSASQRLYFGSDERTVPAFVFERDGTEIQLTVLSTQDLRSPAKTSPAGTPLERARLDVVEALLGES